MWKLSRKEIRLLEYYMGEYVDIAPANAECHLRQIFTEILESMGDPGYEGAIDEVEIHLPGAVK
jgi:hypothetical protein